MKLPIKIKSVANSVKASEKIETDAQVDLSRTDPADHDTILQKNEVTDSTFKKVSTVKKGKEPSDLYPN